MWFSISPLLSEVQDSLNISKEEIWTSSIAAVSGTIVMRFVLGPFCDKYGPRIPMGIILFCSAIPTGLTGLVNSATGLAVLRFFIGIGGSTFVMAQYWYVSNGKNNLWEASPQAFIASISPSPCVSWF
jgi:NNP family nitrate/nitrite transporter-like MFS transporter